MYNLTLFRIQSACVRSAPLWIIGRSASTSAKDKAALLTPKTGTYPKGFITGSIHSGVKKSKPSPESPDTLLYPKDLTCVVSPRHPCTVSAVFTKNAFCAAPVQVSKSVLKESGGVGVHGLLVNSGCANACTGAQGLSNAKLMIKTLDKQIREKFPESQLKASQHDASLVMSTGVIGQQLQMDKIESGLEKLFSKLGSDHTHWLAAAEGIMTTDTFPKLKSFSFPEYHMAGWSKGAGMIHPNMATMLSAIFTDAHISKECLDAAVKYAVDRSFNAISVDGDTSTNDTFSVFANGASADNGAPKIDSTSSNEYLVFRDRLTMCALELSHLIVRDGEGATKFVDIHVKNAKTFEEARQVALTIGTSPLVKTAIYGQDANWGRIVCAIGYSGATIVPEKVNLFLSSASTISASSSPAQNSSLNSPLPTLHLFKNGEPFEINEDVAAQILAQEDIVITADLRLGDAEAHLYTCDFSHEYISINADYRS